MEKTKLQRERLQYRRLFNRSVKIIEAGLTETLEGREASSSQASSLSPGPVISSSIEIEFTYLTENYIRLEELNRQIQDILLREEEYKEEELDKDMDEVAHFKRKYLGVKNTIDRHFHVLATEQGHQSHQTVPCKNFKLPKLEIRKFNDDPKMWIQFWAQYRKIHEDSDICEEDKFQYLIQCMEDGCNAKVLVESYPPSKENYNKVISLVKDRYGKDDMLIEIYIRELLGMVLQQAKEYSLTTDVRMLYDRLNSYIQSLETLGVTKAKYEAILYPLIESAVPSQLLLAYNRSSIGSTQSPDSERLAQLLLFLKHEVDTGERIRLARADYSRGSLSPDIRPPTAAFTTKVRGKYKEVSEFGSHSNNTVTDRKLCLFCDQVGHNAIECQRSNNMTLDDKKEKVKKKGACYVCLKKGHVARQCKAFIKCMSCGKRHVIVLCPDLHKETTKQSEVLFSYNNTTLLQTLIVNVAYKGRVRKIRALLDSGAQRSYLSTEIAKQLQPKVVGKESISHCLFGGVEKKAEEHRCLEFQVSSLNNDFNMNIKVIEMNKLCGYLPKLENTTILQKLKSMNIEIFDIGKEIKEIDLLIGSDYLGSILTKNIVHLGDNLVASKTRLGWTIQGPSPTTTNNNIVLHTYNVQNDLTDLWNIETLGIRDPQEKSEKDILNYFNKNILVNSEGRYEVPLLWRDGHPRLSTNYNQAVKRLQVTSKKLVQTGNFEAYNEVFKEWKRDGVIEEVLYDDYEGHYLPHRPVIKPGSTTKIRPVFDASTKKGGVSLNECIDIGNNLIDSIPKLLVMFRKGAYAVTADIKRAFLQISLVEQDRTFLKFLWWKEHDKYPQTELMTYRHKRVVFGVACSPFILAATLNHHLDTSSRHRDTALILKNSLYVDNCVTSFDSLKDLQIFMNEAKELMEDAKFELRGWITAPQIIDKDVVTVPILGMLWNTVQDDLQCSVELSREVKEELTKRDLLSMIQRVFDPLGLVSPVTLVPKIIMQKAWLENKEWDETLNSDLVAEFKSWTDTIHFLNQCRFPRRLTETTLEACEVSLHVFCDASKQAYAACIYLRTCYNNKVYVQLIMAKSRVSPIKKEMTLPRLELMGALIASRLYKEIMKSGLFEKCQHYDTYFWTDSTVVLAWIKGQIQWKPFVQNRINEIRRNTDMNNWCHLPGKYNPADLPSRGCDAKTFLDTKWWQGPDWLLLNSERWPNSMITSTSEDEKIVYSEKKQYMVTNVDITTVSFSSRLMYFSKYNRIVRLVAWLLRVNPTIRRKYGTQNKELSVEEYENAEKVLIKLLQKENYIEIENSKRNKLNTIIDEDNLIRVKTRLELSNEDKDFVYPILLPGKTEIVQRLIQQRHEKVGHVGSQTLLADLRGRFWITGIRCIVKKILFKCIICRRFKSKSYQVPEAPLPTDRIEAVTVFQVTGIDLAGPLYLKDKQKCWIVLFTCATYRAVHLEICSSLSTEDFSMALRRFLARRGRVTTIYTDNGTNFKGMKNLLDTVNWQEIAMKMTTSAHKIKWRFIPPRAPWWGGWWERIIGTVKGLLRRILGKMCVTYVELYTVLCDCESIINDRPLTYISTDADSFRPLTPALFMHGLSNNDNPDLDHIDTNNLNVRYRYMQKLRNDFKIRFRNEYLSLLTSKHCKKVKEPKVGDVVLIESDTSRINWPLGIIKEVYTGADGLSRVARVQTTMGERVRACQRLYPLELTATCEDARHIIATKGESTLNANLDDSKTDDLGLVTSDPLMDSINRKGPAVTRCGRPVKVPQRFMD